MTAADRTIRAYAAVVRDGLKRVIRLRTEGTQTDRRSLQLFVGRNIYNDCYLCKRGGGVIK